jgi:hypothetical protein
MSFAAGFFLLVWVVGSILVNGVALVHRLTTLRGLELVAYGAAAGVGLHGLLGLGIALVPGARVIFVVLLVVMTFVSTAGLVVRRVLPELSLALSTPSKIALALWGLFLVLNLGLLHLEVRLPEFLPDGPYIFKTPTKNVKVQYLTGMTADNYIAFAVGEFFLRGVCFKTVRPILPGNEVSNRTILMSLVAMPFRVAFGAPHDRPQLGTYQYIAAAWPDVSKLNEGSSFEQFSVVGLVLNSLMLLGLFVFCSSLGANAVLPFAAILYITNPYFIVQTIYTWPKAFAGFFILLAWTSLRSRHHPAIVASLLALAYHCHPYAVVFAGCVGLFYLSGWRTGRIALRSTAIYIGVYIVILAPWFIWTRLLLQIPSDLILQNLSGSGTEAAWASPLNFIWIRLWNFFDLTGLKSLGVSPFDLGWILVYVERSIPGILGLVLIFPALAQCVRLPKPIPWFWYGLCGPAALILAIFSGPAQVILHGYQPLLGALLFFGVWWLSRHCNARVFASLVALQLLMNISLVLVHARNTGAHFW